MTADEILRYFQGSDPWGNKEIKVAELCPYGESIRMDAFSFNRYNRETRGYEIKISRSDFLSDKKHMRYLDFCTFFYFIAPKGLIKAEELYSTIGLIEVTTEVKSYEDESFLSDEDGIKHIRIGHVITKKAKRNPPITQENYIKLLEGLAWKFANKKNLLF